MYQVFGVGGPTVLGGMILGWAVQATRGTLDEMSTQLRDLGMVVLSVFHLPLSSVGMWGDYPTPTAPGY